MYMYMSTVKLHVNLVTLLERERETETDRGEGSAWGENER